MKIKLETKPFRRNYPLRLAVLGALALAALVMVLAGNSPWADAHSAAWHDGYSWAESADAYGILQEDTCRGFSSGTFDHMEWMHGCRDYASAKGVPQSW